MPNALAIHAKAALLDGHWAEDVRVVLADGLICSVTVGAAATPDDERVGLLIPGLPNLHSHAFQRAMAGLGEVRGAGEDSFWSWREAMYRIAGRIAPDTLTAVAALAYIEMLEGGFTRVGEFHYLHHQDDGAPYDDPAEMAAALAAAAEQSGIGLTLLPVFYAHAGFGAQPPQPQQARFVSTPDLFERIHAGSAAALRALPDALLGTAPHSLRAVTPAQLAWLIGVAGTAPLHIHIAEQRREVDDCLAWSGQRPVEWLLDHCPISRTWCLVHATHMTPPETAALARSGAVAGLCPITEANLGDGLFPARRFLEGGGRWGIGSDSNVLIDAFEELRWLEYGQRLGEQRRNVFAQAPGQSTGAALFGAAGQGGAQALGTAFGIAVGGSADLVSLDPGHPALAVCDPAARLDAVIFAGGRSAVDCVWRRGRKVVRSGRHIAREAVAARYAAALKALLA